VFARLCSRHRTGRSIIRRAPTSDKRRHGCSRAAAPSSSVHRSRPASPSAHTADCQSPGGLRHVFFAADAIVDVKSGEGDFETGGVAVFGGLVQPGGDLLLQGGHRATVEGLTAPGCQLIHRASVVLRAGRRCDGFRQVGQVDAGVSEQALHRADAESVEHVVAVDQPITAAAWRFHDLDAPSTIGCLHRVLDLRPGEGVPSSTALPTADRQLPPGSSRPLSAVSVPRRHG
jgi:hypothetical protein